MAAPSGTKRSWLIATTGAAFGVLLVVVAFRLPRNGGAAKTLSLGDRRVVVRTARHDEMALRDLIPLFLPTARNAAPAELRPPTPGARFFDRDAERWRFTESGHGLDLPSPIRALENPIDALPDVPRPLVIGISRSDPAIEVVPPSGGHVDVFTQEMREPIVSMILSPDARPSATSGDRLGWQPLEFVARVDAKGLTGPLMLTRGSGLEEIDEYFRNYLARSFRIGERLPPGFYRVVVGP